MADVVGRLSTAAAGLSRAIEGAEAKHAWEANSPCEGWTAGDVADHIIDNYVGVALALGTAVTRTEHRAQDWLTVRDTVLAGAARDGALDIVAAGPGGPMPLGRLLAVFVLVDTLLHTWDIAHAVGIDESLDEELCRRCYERFLPADETIRGPATFGAKLDYAEDDRIQVKTLRFFGRSA